MACQVQVVDKLFPLLLTVRCRQNITTARSTNTAMISRITDLTAHALIELQYNVRFSTALDGVVILLDARRSDADARVLQKKLGIHVAQHLSVSFGLHDLVRAREGVPVSGRLHSLGMPIEARGKMCARITDVHSNRTMGCRMPHNAQSASIAERFRSRGPF